MEKFWRAISVFAFIVAPLTTLILAPSLLFCAPGWAGAVMPPGGANGQIQINNGGSFGGVNSIPIPINAQTGGTYIVQTTDQGVLITLNNSSGPAVTMLASNSVPTGWSTTIENVGGMPASIVPAGTDTFVWISGGGFQGPNVVSLGQWESATLISNGTSQWTIIPSIGSSNLSPHPGYVASASSFYPPPGYIPATGVASAAQQNNLTCTWFQTANSEVSWNGYRVYVDTSAASTNVQFFMFANNPATNRPGKRINYTGAVATTSTGAVTAYQGAGNQPWGGQGFWSCTNQDNTTVALRSNSGYATAAFIGSTSASSANLFSLTAPTLCIRSAASVAFNTYPSDLSTQTWNEVTTAGTCPLVLFGAYLKP